MSIRMNPAALAEIMLRAQHLQEQALEEIAQDARRMAPVETGRLRASIKVEGDKVTVGTDHWIYPEYGTENMHAQPYMRPALYRKRHLRGLS